jgi:hypothetical protein
LFAIFFGLIVWPGVFLWFDIEGPTPLVVTLGAFGLLLWLTGVTYARDATLWRSGRLKQQPVVAGFAREDNAA